MTHQEIQNAIAQLGSAMRDLEEAYIENGGEVTEDTELKEMNVTAIQDLLTTEGVDSLGRWLKSKQDEILTAKAEKAAAEARIRSLQKSEAYIKDMIGYVLRVTGQEKVKGAFYGFSQAESSKSTVVMDKVNEDWLLTVEAAARAAGLPPCIDVELKTTTTRLKEEGYLNYVDVEVAESVRFSKPRAAKEA